MSVFGGVCQKLLSKDLFIQDLHFQNHYRRKFVAYNPQSEHGDCRLPHK
jgi:hypothetical protein